jgi:hypothetical protein
MQSTLFPVKSQKESVKKASSAISSRRKRCVESFQSAAECIGEIQPGISLFAVTRGQFSMIDATLVCLDQVGPADVSIWTWTVAGYEIECFDRLRQDGRIKRGTLVIDHSARGRNADLLDRWKKSFGEESVRYVVNHSKIVTIETAEVKLLLRGSMNLNFNARFEQFDLTEGGLDFDLVRRVENELPCLPDDASGADVYRASRVAEAFEPEQLAFFQGAKVWAK